MNKRSEPKSLVSIAVLQLHSAEEVEGDTGGDNLAKVIVKYYASKTKCAQTGGIGR